ncbi:ubiquitin-related modifier 1-like isoform X2 [Varroa jacobsoni]|uniref:Ubiquitin-related modifier 1 homolog n=1 Tax=Varroa destructor TaxID=109461 RepID=A0A7M7KT01_VARDE|nr:ubiquitin-related modifier 1-like isoform X2 [Varroa destructor]XP_022709256.1 ubiquitin-related modifier 1-like isoform X2 [Varroa jacobsoni]
MCDITVEFAGGAELLFDNKKKHNITLPPADEGSVWTVTRLIHWLAKNLLTGNPDLFIQKDSIRPGILVLVNDTDWELLLVSYSYHNRKLDICSC